MNEINEADKKRYSEAYMRQLYMQREHTLNALADCEARLEVANEKIKTLEAEVAKYVQAMPGDPPAQV